MERILIYVFLLLATSNGIITAQDIIHGKVVDSQNNPIEGAAVVLQTIDSVYVDAVITDSIGGFFLNRQADQGYRLLFQHLLFDPCQAEITVEDAGVIQMNERNYELDGVVVKAERAKVKVENGALKYDAPHLVQDKAVSNAYEVLRHIPGIIGTGEVIQLLGAGTPGIILNGQISTMSVDQLISLLKTIPASRVLNVEVMYNAPAKYNMKGALINVLLDQGTSEMNILQGEVGIDYEQRHYAAGKIHANLLYSASGLNVDLLVEGDKGCDFTGEEILARHTLNDKVTEVYQFGRASKKRTDGTIRLGMDYTFKNEDKLSAAYYLSDDNAKSARSATTTYRELPSEKLLDDRMSYTNRHDKSILHNVRLQYDGHKGLMAGIDFTHYQSPSSQTFLDSNVIGIQTDLLNNSDQGISQGALFINHTHTFRAGWTLNYGVHGGFTSSKTYMDYLYNKGSGYEPDENSFENNYQKEYNGNVFMEASKSFGEHFSATASLKTEYFKSDYEVNGAKSTLWNDWALFPNASMNYTFTPSHILQLNVNSDKVYPSYWAVTSQVTPINSYSSIVGNPALKPYRSYQGQLLYILKQKYTILAYCNYDPDYFAQLPYQSSSNLKNIFRFENMDYRLQTGMGVVVPFSAGDFWSSEVTVLGMRWQEKMAHFHDASFNNVKYMGQFIMNNTFTLSKVRPNLKLDLNGYYVTGAIQGPFELESVFDVSAALKWQFANDRAILMLKCNDIFQSNMPRTMKINTGNQHSRLKSVSDIRCISVSFVWKIGGYKKKEHREVDASRFGK